MKKLVQNLFFIFLSISFLSHAHAGLDAERIEELKHGVVSIKLQESSAAYANPVTAHGTGFVIDPYKGIILTNRHIASSDKVASYKAQFFGGEKTDVKLMWNDPHHDFSFLKVDPETLPKDIPHLKFSLPKIGEEVLIVGNNECNSFSVQTGAVTDLFEVDVIGAFAPQHTVRMSMNTMGGSSGSPVFNQQGEVIGLNCGGTARTVAVSVPIAYIQDALEHVSKDHKPPRYSTGACFKVLNLDDARKYYKYDDPLIKEQIAEISGSRSKILQVEYILSQTPAMEKLKVGDIIESIEGKIIGPDSYKLEKILNELGGKSALMTVWRNKEKLTLNVPTFDLNAAECTTFLNFGNSIIAPANFHLSFVTDMPFKSVCMTHFPGGSVFSELEQENNDTCFMFEEVSGSPINTFDNFISIIPRVTKDQNFYFMGRFFGDRGPHCRQGSIMKEADYNPEHYGKPFTISFDPKKMDWVREEINLEK